MNHSETSLRSNPHIVPPDSLLKFGYTPNGGVMFDSANSVLSILYSGASKAEFGAFGVTLPDGEGLVIGHTAQVTAGTATDELQVLGSEAADSRATIGRFSNDSSGPRINFAKSKSTDFGVTPAIVADGNDLGIINWTADDGQDQVSAAAYVKAAIDGTPGADDVPGRLVFGTSADGASNPSERMRIDSSGGVFIGEAANVNMTVGLTLNQGANDDQIVSLKSSDIAHGLVSGGFEPYETDDFFTIKKANTTLGGATLTAITEDAAHQNPFSFHSVGGTADTTKTTAAKSLAEFVVTEHDGSNALANITADGNIFGVRARVGGLLLARFLVDEDGDMYSVTAGQTFDDYDDAAILDTYDMVRSGGLKHDIKAGFGKVMSMNEQTLIDMGVLGAPMSEGGLTNQTQLSRVLVGNARQQKTAHLNLVERVDALTFELEAAIKKLAALTA